jgi:acylphosphatase
MVAHTFHVTGLVQGVGFRWSAQAEARRLGVVGWVTNAEDGAVSGFVQGDEPRVALFAQWLNQGPPRARVDAVLLPAAEVRPGLASFLVRPSPKPTSPERP